VSIASATTFTRIAYPEMTKYGYSKSFSLGTIAGSGCLGMLIPPSVLMIVWGILTEQSIGKLFLAGVLPGLILTSLFAGYIIITAIVNPAAVGEAHKRKAQAAGSDVTPGADIEIDEGPEISPRDMAVSGSGVPDCCRAWRYLGRPVHADRSGGHRRADRLVAGPDQGTTVAGHL
jgi:TRAP-type mannitol/chloroaromatic compound transport system permease large subunit